MMSGNRGWVYWLSWIFSIGLVGFASYIGMQRFSLSHEAAVEIELQPTIVEVQLPKGEAKLPSFVGIGVQAILQRKAMLNTLIPSRPRTRIVEYTVDQGDSVFAIASNYGIQPETLLWSNYDVLKDDPHSLAPGMQLKIPPVDGVYYQWQDVDSLQSVADSFEVDANNILTWSGNRLDLTNPQVEVDSWVMIPGGQREFQQWIVPVPARGSAGVSSGIYGGGACPGGYDGLYGSGAFIWPVNNQTLSGNDYWSGHLAIDIGVVLGDSVMAADAGVIMFAGWSSGGYGYTVAIDHGNGYQTLYGHLSGVSVACGQSVRQGQLIGLGGSSGNSTGPHLHFEVRLNGGFVNPWYVLP
ncbi:MAG: peptidoglycan DD-metalloendopeptidase family protein [Anaerolineales bacterium]|nr:peptidoglycan DD-metalloendopeptidase family protein [Chloroflexota bacterium]MBL6981725.1 peptidoglycan DD-metalloendopeptidase family protein [Anaerolineales bacterium]